MTEGFHADDLERTGGEPAPPFEGGDGVSNDSDEEWIKDSLATLASALHRGGARFEDTVDRVLGSSLAAPVDGTTIGKCYDAVAAVLGPDAADVLLTILLRAVDDSSFLRDRLGRTDEEVVNWLVGMSGLHGDALKQANLLDGREPDGWKDIYRRLYYEVITGRWYMQFELVKNDGTRFVVHDDPASLLLVADTIVDTLTRLPAQAAREVLETYLERFRRSVDTLNNLLSQEVEGLSAAEALEGSLPV